MRSAVLCILLLAACNRDRETQAMANGAEQPAQPIPAASSAAVQPAAKPVSIEGQTDLLDFHMAWPAEVSAIPALEEKIRVAALKHKADLLKLAAEDKAGRTRDGIEFHGYEFSVDLEVAGQTPRLLSLTRNWSEYTGGAHPNHGTEGLLWDRAANRRISVYDLLSGGEDALPPLIRDAYCKALEKERRERRGPEDTAAAADPDDPFNQCPALGDVAIVPTAGKGSAVFDRILLHADAYLAGPYAEGDYDIELPVTKTFIEALRPEYRASFSAQRQ